MAAQLQPPGEGEMLCKVPVSVLPSGKGHGSLLTTTVPRRAAPRGVQPTVYGYHDPGHGAEEVKEGSPLGSASTCGIKIPSWGGEENPRRCLQRPVLPETAQDWEEKGSV